MVGPSDGGIEGGAGGDGGGWGMGAGKGALRGPLGIESILVDDGIPVGGSTITNVLSESVSSESISIASETESNTRGRVIGVVGAEGEPSEASVARVGRSSAMDDCDHLRARSTTGAIKRMA